jgi:hypothetical protein
MAYGANNTGLVVGQAIRSSPPSGSFQKAILWQKDAARATPHNTSGSATLPSVQ